MGNPGVTAPARLGRYELLARLASGGMGEIFLSRLEGAAGFEKLLVLKRILPHLADDARFRAMLIAEARIASRMAHANICQVYELGETDGQLYIVMEYLEGIGLLSLLRKASKEGAPLDLGFVGGVVQQCTDALHYAHELRDRDNELLGIVHRDVTPGNIYITESGVVKLLDFGIAKVKDASANTQTGTVKGKYAYMAPEQLRGHAVDRRVDVFALGVVIYEMLALRRLFQRKTDYLTFRAVMEQPIPDIRRYRTDIPDALADVVMRALDRDPDRRPSTARQLGSSVSAAIGQQWSQGDLGDFLRTHLADEINRRRVETARALQWSSSGTARALAASGAVPAGGTAGAAVPASLGIGGEELAGEAGEGEDDEDFPAVEEVEDGQLEERPTSEYDGQLGGPASGAYAQFSAAGASLAPVAVQPGGPPEMVVVHKRSVLWPLLALAMVGITAAALFFVWKQTQKPQAPIVVTAEPAVVPPGPEPRPGPGSSGSAEVRPLGAGSAAGSAGSGAKTAAPGGGSGRKRTTPPQQGSDAQGSGAPNEYTKVINQHQGRMQSCLETNQLPETAKGTVKVTLVVQPSGKPKAVSFEPSTLDGTGVGACIKRTLVAASFPVAKSEVTVTFPMALSERR